MARSCAFRTLSRTEARRFGKVDMACGQLGDRRDSLHDAQDWTANRVAADATAQRLLVHVASERQSKRFHFPSRGECEPDRHAFQSVPGYSRWRWPCRTARTREHW